MFAFIFGLGMGVGGTYFFNRFKDSLAVFKKKTEAKIEEVLKK